MTQYNCRREIMKTFLGALLFLSTFFGSQWSIYGFGIIDGGHYRIQSMEDGLFISAAYPTFEDGVNLGELTTEKWTNSREQRWDAIAFDIARNEYLLFSQENTFNRLTALYKGDRPTKHISEVIPVEKKRYLIRSLVRDACLVNPGYGLKIIFAVCNASAKNQQWEFDLLTKQ